MRYGRTLAWMALVLAGCGGTDGGGSGAAPGGWPAGDSGAGAGGHDAGSSGTSGTDGGTTGSTGGPDGSSSSPTDSGTSAPAEASAPTDAGTTPVPAGFVFSPYKDTSVISTSVTGTATTLAADMLASGGKAITLAFATGECGSESWGGVDGGTLASTNVPLFTKAGVGYVVSTGGADGSFTCGTDAGMTTFLQRWASPQLLGVDFDIEAGQSASVIQDLVTRIQTAHGSYPALRFSLTIGTLANNDGASTAQSLGASVADSLNTYGDDVLAAIHQTFGATWPAYVTIDLMTMDYGSASDGVCVVSGGVCDMGQSALQAAYNLHDHWGVPYANIELTPMIGQNDASSEQFTLANATTVAHFALAQGLAGVHYWSYDRDVDCAAGSASATCSSMGTSYAGAHGFLKTFLSAGLE
jgi:hypothetical protein